MEPDRRRRRLGTGSRRQSVFRSLDDYERHMQDSVGTDDEPYYEDPPHEEYKRSPRSGELDYPSP